ncbi:MAG: hypothetical protein Q9169_004269 [Polycauliona sp. 2 TL-2023]
MAGQLKTKQLALSIRDLVAAKTFDQAVFNENLHPHAEIVFSGQSQPAAHPDSPAAQSSVQLNHIHSRHGNPFIPPKLSAGPFNGDGNPDSLLDSTSLNRYDSQTTTKVRERPSLTLKRKRLNSTTEPAHAAEETPRTSSSGPINQSSTRGSSGIMGENVMASAARAQRLAKQDFVKTWEPLINHRTKLTGVINSLFEYKSLQPPKNKTAIPVPYSQLQDLMEFVDSWASPNSRHQVIMELQEAPLINQDIERPCLEFPAELKSFEPHLQRDLYEVWKAARLADYWSHKKRKYKILRLTAVFKEIRAFQKVLPTKYHVWSLDTSSFRVVLGRDELHRMYQTFRASTAKSSRICHQFGRNG